MDQMREASAVPASGTDVTRIRFSIVSAVYNVSRYLADFIASIEAQTFPLHRVQVIMVDDGSTDDSLRVLEAWRAARPDLVTVLTKNNGGQGSARNLGLERAVGEWVTFVDPDDTIEPDYLQTVDAFLERNSGAAMVATKRMLFLENTGEIVDGHWLRQMFAGRDQLVDLDRFPEYFHGHAPSSFLRTQVVRDTALRFDDRIRPNFEDGHFCARYLLGCAAPIVGFVGSARYIYRKRADGSSTLQVGLSDPGRFVNVPRYGYLDLLRATSRPDRAAPEWLQNFILYELSFYFSADVAPNGGHTAARGVVAEQFVDTLRSIADLLDPDVVDSFAIRPFDRVWRDILLHGLRESNWHTPYAMIRQYDEAKDQVQIVYRYSGRPPHEVVLLRGKPFQPRHAKTRTHIYFEQPLMCERIIWVPASGTVRVQLDGRPVELRRSWPSRKITQARPAQLAARPAPSPGKVRPRLADQVQRVLLIRLARTGVVRRLFGRAWVLIDRTHNADDSAERLFRYLRERRRGVNAWFVVERGTPDWKRLRRDGYRRVIPHGSTLWKLLMLNCEHLISSHIDTPVYRPPDILKLRKPTWKYTFLQHGVIKDDLSRWLNSKHIDLFVTSTPGEHRSIVADGSPYAVTTREVKMTGLPRFDRLLEIGSTIGPKDRDLVLVCPTWRHWLSPSLPPNSQRRVVTDDFLTSEYAQRWLEFLSDERLAALGKGYGLRIGFLPHPNIQPALERMTLPEHVEALTFAGQDVQRLVARSALMVTDYSSMAFNAAYIDRPVLYYQFDEDRVLGGGHVGRGGYFRYAVDGFGPVARDLDEAMSALKAIMAAGSNAPEYEARISAAFPVRDGKCCSRVVKAIEDLTR